MSCAVSESPLDVVPKTGLVHFGLHQKQQIHEVLHARVVLIDPGTRVRVELFSVLLLSGDHAECGPQQTGEIKPPLTTGDVLSRDARTRVFSVA